MNFNKEMSRKYGMKVYDSTNPQFPYYVEGMDDFDGNECFTEDELKMFAEYHNDGECGDKCMWANMIIGWFDSVKSEPERWDEEITEIVDEVNWFIETMFDLDNLPEWAKDYANELEENLLAEPYVYVNILEKVLPNIW